MAAPLSSRRTERALLALGFVRLGTRGSHVKLKAPNGGIVVLPLGHAQVLDIYVRRACVLAEIPWQDFRDRY